MTYLWSSIAGLTTSSVVLSISSTNKSKGIQTTNPAQSTLDNKWTTNTSAPTTSSSRIVSNNTSTTKGIAISFLVTNSSVNGSVSTLPYGYTDIINITGLSKLINKLSSARPTIIGQSTDSSKSLTISIHYILLLL